MARRQLRTLSSRPASTNHSRLHMVHTLRQGFRRVQGMLGRHISVRGKLTLWYGAMCAVTLAGAGLAMRAYLDNRFSRSIDDGLLNSAIQLQSELARPLPSQPWPAFSTVKRCTGVPLSVEYYCARAKQELNTLASQLYTPGQFQEIEIVTNPRSTNSATIRPQGQLSTAVPAIDLYSLAEVAGSGQPLWQRLTSSSSRSSCGSTPCSGGTVTWRAYIAPVQVPPDMSRQGVVALVEVFQNEHTYLDIERQFDLTLLLGIPLGVILTLVAGWWIARAALRPINRISRNVRAIGESKDLSRRLNFVGPYDEVGRLAETFDGMMNRLEKVFETQKRFIADASHELRTPLTAIRGNADLMRIAPPDERDVCLAAIRRESERMSRLVTDLLLLAEADVAQHPFAAKPVDLDEIVMDVYRSAQIVSSGKVGVVLERADPMCVHGDPDRLKQLFLNLADNAVKFTPPGGTISMGVYQEGDMARVDVSDSGIGIPAEEQASIFERFYRVEASRSKRGSGLGLSICASIARAHGGTIEVHSRPGKGSTFTVRLPVAAPQSQSAPAPRAVAGT